MMDEAQQVIEDLRIQRNITEDALATCEKFVLRNNRILKRLLVWAKQEQTGPWQNPEAQAWVVGQIEEALKAV